MAWNPPDSSFARPDRNYWKFAALAFGLVLLLLAAGTWLYESNPNWVYRLPASQESPSEYLGRVHRFYSPDSYEIVDREGKTHSVRLAGVDCPEPGQPQFRQAMKCVRQRLASELLTLKVYHRDRWGIEFASIQSKDIDLGSELLDSGLGWFVPSEHNPWPELISSQERAKSARVGIWSDEAPRRPEEAVRILWDDQARQIEQLFENSPSH